MSKSEWTRQHDIDLAVAYLGCTTVVLTPGGKKHLVSANGSFVTALDMTQRDCAEAIMCLEMWLSYESGRDVDIGTIGKTYRVVLNCFYGKQSVGIGCGAAINEALAWALWEARGK